MNPDPFMTDALDANRHGELTDQQRNGFAAWARSRRRSAFSTAGYLAAGAAIVLFFASPTASPTARALIPATALGIAAVLVIRAMTGADALTRDLRTPRVETAEGPIGKRQMSGRGGPQNHVYWLDVGNQTFKVGRTTFADAPDHGIVRLYFLPHSRKIVNLERLANPPLPDLGTPQGLVDSLRTALTAPSRSERNEARAAIAGVGPPAAASRDARPLAELIVGTWVSPLMTVTFSADGHVVLHMLGAERGGHWSIDGAGRLQSDIMGAPATTDAWVTGDQLTIALEDQNMIFTRRS
jgi:hypothetical protein